MRTFEFSFLTAEGEVLTIGIVEAETLAEAVREVGEYHVFDRDAARMTIGEAGE